ncbi:MAG TPA: helix-turn-helix transcriptional regulator [Burkholderiaceae bacterium]|nr:helix-turn-helix transcriptional regulator [Burkholderiaceae bacterium]
MLDLLPAIEARNAAPAPRPYEGPDRRSAASRLITRWFAQMLDEIDYGMLLLTDGTQVAHANHAAQRALDDEHPLQLLGHELRVRRTRDLAPLHQALANAAQRGLRSLLALGEERQRICIAVVPLPAFDGDRHAALLLFGKRQVCEELSVQSFARAHGLTFTETQVLTLLCDGVLPAEIARRQRVALSTVRTQIGSVRAKTGAQSIRDLVQQVSVLPPMVGALRVAPSAAARSVAAFTCAPAAGTMADGVPLARRTASWPAPSRTTSSIC